MCIRVVLHQNFAKLAQIAKFWGFYLQIYLSHFSLFFRVLVFNCFCLVFICSRYHAACCDSLGRLGFFLFLSSIFLFLLC